MTNDERIVKYYDRLLRYVAANPFVRVPDLINRVAEGYQVKARAYSDAAELK